MQKREAMRQWIRENQRCYTTPAGAKHNVDVNLRNEWLDALNSLSALELTSICEGHPTQTDMPFSHNGRSLFPCVVLRFKRGYANLLDAVDEGSPLLLQGVQDLLYCETATTINNRAKGELQELMEHRDSSISEYTLTQLVWSLRACIRIESRVPRRESGAETTMVRWFDQLVDSAQKFDGWLGCEAGKQVVKGSAHALPPSGAFTGGGAHRLEKRRS